MYDDPCPNCGFRRKRTVMSIDPNGPSLRGIWNGEAGLFMQGLARTGGYLFAILVVAVIIHAISISGII